MACAKCSFYLPKESAAATLLAGKRNLLRMRQEIPLTDSEIAALDDGVSALQSLLNRLADIPTPSGKTPLQIREQSLLQIACMTSRCAHDRNRQAQLVALQTEEAVPLDILHI
jgi:hypothetical protein